jgi:putative SbcD/Mre11-related phosphoesterase
MPQTRIVPTKPVFVLEGKKKSIVVADIHIGFESSMASNKIFMGKNLTTNESIREITDIIDLEKPDSIILLGDVKSSIKNITRSEWDEVPLFFKKIGEKCDVILVPGNHDANIQKMVPDNVSMISSTGMVEENILFTHGHVMPSENFSHVDKIVMGHLHPVFFQEGSIINGQRVWVSIKTEKENIFPNKSGEIEITIVPSFNRYFYATHRRQYRKSTSPIISRIKTISRAKIITLDGTIIGDESNLDQVI